MNKYYKINKLFFYKEVNKYIYVKNIDFMQFIFNFWKEKRWIE